MTPEKLAATRLLYRMVMECCNVADRHKLDFVAVVFDHETPANDPTRMLCMSNSMADDSLSVLGIAHKALIDNMSKSAHAADGMLEDLLKGKKI